MSWSVWEKFRMRHVFQKKEKPWWQEQMWLWDLPKIHTHNQCEAVFKGHWTLSVGPSQQHKHVHNAHTSKKSGTSIETSAKCLELVQEVGMLCPKQALPFSKTLASHFGQFITIESKGPTKWGLSVSILSQLAWPSNEFLLWHVFAWTPEFCDNVDFNLWSIKLFSALWTSQNS